MQKPRDIHVVPLGDTLPHEEIRQCWCRPHVSGTVVIHYAADGREYFEDRSDWIECPEPIPQETRH